MRTDGGGGLEGWAGRMAVKEQKEKGQQRQQKQGQQRKRPAQASPVTGTGGSGLMNGSPASSSPKKQQHSRRSRASRADGAHSPVLQSSEEMTEDSDVIDSPVTPAKATPAKVLSAVTPRSLLRRTVATETAADDEEGDVIVSPSRQTSSSSSSSATVAQEAADLLLALMMTSLQAANARANAASISRSDSSDVTTPAPSGRTATDVTAPSGRTDDDVSTVTPSAAAGGEASNSGNAPVISPLSRSAANKDAERSMVATDVSASAMLSDVASDSGSNDKDSDDGDTGDATEKGPAKYSSPSQPACAWGVCLFVLAWWLVAIGTLLTLSPVDLTSAITTALAPLLSAAAPPVSLITAPSASPYVTVSSSSSGSRSGSSSSSSPNYPHTITLTHSDVVWLGGKRWGLLTQQHGALMDVELISDRQPGVSDCTCVAATEEDAAQKEVDGGNAPTDGEGAAAEITSSDASPSSSTVDEQSHSASPLPYLSAQDSSITVLPPRQYVCHCRSSAGGGVISLSAISYMRTIADDVDNSTGDHSKDDIQQEQQIETEAQEIAVEALPQEAQADRE